MGPNYVVGCIRDPVWVDTPTSQTNCFDPATRNVVNYMSITAIMFIAPGMPTISTLQFGVPISESVASSIWGIGFIQFVLQQINPAPGGWD